MFFPGTGYRSYRPSPSQRLDGYTSDTTMFADEDEEDFTIPLHINTSTTSGHKVTNGSSAPVSPLLPHRTSSRRHYTTTSQFNTISNSNTIGRHKPDHFDKERPFVAVKRSHELNRKYSDSTVSDVCAFPDS